MALMLMVLLPCTGFSQFRVAKFLSFFGAARTQILVITRNQSLLWCSKFMLCNDFLPWIGFTNVRKLPLSNSLTFRVFPTVDDVEGIYIVQMFLKKGSANRRNWFYYIMKHSHEENSNNFDFREPWCFSSLKKKTHTVPSCSCSAASVGAQGSWHQFVYSAARWINIAPIPSQIVRATMRFLFDSRMFGFRILPARLLRRYNYSLQMR